MPTGLPATLLDLLQVRAGAGAGAEGRTGRNLTRYVPGQAVTEEDAGQQRRRGRDLARLHLALRGLDERLGQRAGFRAQHQGVTLGTDLDWTACVRALAQVSPRLGAWATAAAGRTHETLAAIGADALPVMVVHGDFAPWNVHYRHGRLAGVIDLGLTHLDSRPYELAIARTWRAPAALEAYRRELARLGWPLSELEEAAIQPLYHAFRLDQIAWPLTRGPADGRVRPGPGRAPAIQDRNQPAVIASGRLSARGRRTGW